MGTFCRRPGRTACVIAPSAAKPLALPSRQQPALSPGQFVGAEPGPRQGVDNLLLRRNGGPFHHLSALEPTACQDRKLRRTVLTLFLASLTKTLTTTARPRPGSGKSTSWLAAASNFRMARRSALAVMSSREGIQTTPLCPGELPGSVSV